MGQVPLKPSPLLGEVELGLEAIVLLESREERHSEVVRVRPSTPSPPPQPTTGHVPLQRRRSSRKHRPSSIHRKDFCCIGNERVESAGEDEEPRGTCDEDMTDSPLLFEMEQQQLADVYYSAFYLHPPREVLVQEGATALHLTIGDEEGCTTTVTRDELKTKLKEIFDVDDRAMATIEQDVLKREPPRTTLHVTVHEAKGLKPKTPKETSHPFCLVRVLGSNESETRRTPVVLSTLNPAWQQEFKFCLPCSRDAKLLVEVWHEPQEAGVEQLMGMKDLRELGRMVRDAAASLQTKETRNLLGTVTIPLPDARGHSVEGWYNLAKGKEDGKNQPSARESFREHKKRGSVHISFRLCTSAQLNLIGPHWYNGFLNKVVQHHLQYMSSFIHRTRGGSARCERGPYCHRNIFFHSMRRSRSLGSTHRPYRLSSESSSSSESSYENEVLCKLPTVWDGNVHRTCSTLLDHYSTTLNLSPAATTLSWWNITSKFPVVDQAFLGKLLKQLQEYIAEDKFSQHDIEEISSSVKLWAESEFNRLRNLTTHFPAASSRVVSHDQIKYLLANFHMLGANPYAQCLPRGAAVSELVSEALTDFVKKWWECTLKNRGKNSTLAHEDQQLKIAVTVAGEVCTFLTDVSNSYHGVFLREAKISYLKLTYILLTSELAACVRPLLHRIYNDNQTSKQRLPHPGSQQVQHEEVDKPCLEAGTPIWQLYKKLEQIQTIGDNLPTEVQLQSGLLGYHQWFVGGVTRWQERLMANTKSLLTKEVERDTFKIDSADISTSAVETMNNIIANLNLWEKLAWPDDNDILEKKLMKDLCSLGTLYTKLVINKLEGGSQEEKLLSATSLSSKNCTILNNIEYLRQEINKLLKPCDQAKDSVDDRFSVASKTLSKMEASILCIMDSAIRKLKSTLHTAVVLSCETANEAHLLHSVLDEDLNVLRHRLSESNFKRLLLKLWSNLIVIFCSIVDCNSARREAEYFKGVYRVLEKMWYFFTPVDRRGLDPHHAHTQEYQSLQKILRSRMISTECLIAKYYRERYEELQQAYNTCIAELVVNVFFHVSGKLIVEVVIGRNIMSSVKSSNFYVQMKLVPGDWFPKAQSHKTSIQARRSDSLCYEETFEWSLSPDEAGVRNGYLLFLLKTKHRLRTDEEIAETVVSLEELPTLDTAAAKNVIKKVLYMNIPRKEEDYAAIKALRLRTWDRRAQSFLKIFQEKT